MKILEAEERGEEIYPLSISREVGSPYSYVSKVLSELESNAIIESRHVGRTRVVKLTENGRSLAEKLRELRKELSKDFVSRKKLSIIEQFIEKYSDMEFDGESAVFVCAPLEMELESLIEQLEGKDVEAYEFARKLMSAVERFKSAKTS